MYTALCDRAIASLLLSSKGHGGLVFSLASDAKAAGGSRCVWHSDANNWEITGCLWRLMGLGAGMPCSRLGFIGQLKVEAGHTHLYKQRLCNGPSQAGHEKALPPHQEGWEERVLRFLRNISPATAWVRDEAKGKEGKQS